MYKVTRPFKAEGFDRISGEVLDADGYRLLPKLINLRYLAKLDNHVKLSKCQLCDRQFIDAKLLEGHYIEVHPTEIEIVPEPEVVKKGSV